MALDERLKHELERAGRPADPSGVYEDLIRRRERRRIARKVRGLALVVSVVAVTAIGFAALTRVFPSRESNVASLPENGLIAFSDIRIDGFDEDGLNVIDDWHLYTVDPATGQRTRLGPDAVEEALYPTWSPDGSTIAFIGFTDVSSNPPREAVYIANADGTEVTEIFRVPDDQQVEGLRWSPDGSRIGYQLAAPEPNGSPGVPSYTIWSMAADGTDHRQITTTGREMHFAWSPDGERIVVERFEPAAEMRDVATAATDLFVVEVDGGNEFRLTDDGISRDPSWSPDGSQIAFSRGAAGERHVALVWIDGTDVREFEHASINEAGATLPYGNKVMWSPDGSMIAFADRSNGADVCSISLLSVDDGDIQTLLSSPGERGCPGQEGMSWAPAIEPRFDETLPTPTPTTVPSGNLDEPVALDGVPFPVCDVDSLGWLSDVHGFGQALTFEEAVSDVCDSAVEGPQYLGVTTESAEGIHRVDGYFGPLDRCVEPTGCWVYATPELDGDPPDEILLLTNGAPGRIEVWFMDVSVEGNEFTVRPFEAVCEGNLDCDPMMIAAIDWEPPGLAGLSCGRFAPDGSYSYSPGDDFYEWSSDTGDGWSAWRLSFADGRVSVDPLREDVSHGDPRDEFAPSDEGEICLEAAAVPPYVVAD